MSDVISLEWIGGQLRAIQAEQRTLRAENELLRNAIGDMLRVLNDRIGNFEALAEARIDHLASAVTARFDALDQTLIALPDRLTEHIERIVRATPRP